MAEVEEIVKIQGFRGLGDPFIPRFDPKVTRSLTNVRTQFGRIIGRNGFTTLGAAAATNIIGMSDFRATDGTVYLTRIRKRDATGDKFDYWTGSIWSNDFDFGVSSSDSDTAFVDYVTHNNKLYFIDPVFTQLFSWAGPGTGAATGSPAGRMVASFNGYLLIARSASNIDIRYDNADNGGTWPVGNTLNLRETQGAIQRILPLGKTLFAYKTDGAVALRFVGSASTTFSQERTPFGIGLLASASLKEIPGIGHILLASDGQLYINDGNLIQPVLPDLNNTLVNDINKAYAYQAYADLNQPQSIYTLFYPSGSNTILNKRLEFNYRTGEFTIFSYSTGFDRMIYSQYQSNVNTPDLDLVTSKTTQSYVADDFATDNGTAISYEWRSDWFDLGNSKTKTIKWLTLLFDKGSLGKVDISIARDFKSTFEQTKIIDLTPDANESSDTMAFYDLSDRGVKARYINLRIRFYPASKGTDISLHTIVAYFTREADEGSAIKKIP